MKILILHQMKTAFLHWCTRFATVQEAVDQGVGRKQNQLWLMISYWLLTELIQ